MRRPLTPEEKRLLPDLDYIEMDDRLMPLAEVAVVSTPYIDPADFSARTIRTLVVKVAEPRVIEKINLAGMSPKDQAKTVINAIDRAATGQTLGLDTKPPGN